MQVTRTKYKRNRLPKMLLDELSPNELFLVMMTTIQSELKRNTGYLSVTRRENVFAPKNDRINNKNLFTVASR